MPEAYLCGIRALCYSVFEKSRSAVVGYIQLVLVIRCLSFQPYKKEAFYFHVVKESELGEDANVKNLELSPRFLLLLSSREETRTTSLIKLNFSRRHDQNANGTYI